MRRFGILFFIFILLSFGPVCQAQSQYSAVISKMENSLFGMDYGSQSDEARLKRIEENVYGSTSSKPLSQRVSRLSSDLSADLIGKEIKPKRDTFEEDENGNTEAIPKADKSVSYPIVDNMEKEVLHNEYKTMDITQRLSNLEQKVFGKSYKDDLNTRVDRLKHAVIPERVAQENSQDDSQGYSAGDADDYAPSHDYSKDDTSNFGQDSLSQDAFNPRDLLGMAGPIVPQYNRQNSVLDNYPANLDISVSLAQVEKKVLRKSFPDDSVNNRLARLEIKVFSSTFPDDDEQTRLDRITSAYQAQKTAKRYDSNKFSQHAATAMQIGAILLMILAAVI